MAKNSKKSKSLPKLDLHASLDSAVAAAEKYAEVAKGLVGELQSQLADLKAVQDDLVTKSNAYFAKATELAEETLGATGAAVLEKIAATFPKPPRPGWMPGGAAGEAPPEPEADEAAGEAAGDAADDAAVAMVAEPPRPAQATAKKAAAQKTTQKTAQKTAKKTVKRAPAKKAVAADALFEDAPERQAPVKKAVAKKAAGKKAAMSKAQPKKTTDDESSEPADERTVPLISEGPAGGEPAEGRPDPADAPPLSEGPPED